MLVESRTSGRRYRADHLIEEATGTEAEGLSAEELTEIIQTDERVKDPSDGGRDFTPVRPFNLMFETYTGPVKTPENIAYLRPETAQGMFVEPGTDREWHEYWIEERLEWYLDLGLNPENLRKREQSHDERAPYAARGVDIEYNFPFRGWSELEGIANRTDYDLKKHAAYSGENLEYFDQATNRRYFPYVIEPAAGPDRIMLAFLVDSYVEEEVEGEKRTVLKLHPRLAPVKAAVFPLSKKEPVSTIARELYDDLKGDYSIFYDDSG